MDLLTVQAPDDGIAVLQGPPRGTERISLKDAIILLGTIVELLITIHTATMPLHLMHMAALTYLVFAETDIATLDPI